MGANSFLLEYTTFQKGVGVEAIKLEANAENLVVSFVVHLQDVNYSYLRHEDILFHTECLIHFINYF